MGICRSARQLAVDGAVRTRAVGGVRAVAGQARKRKIGLAGRQVQDPAHLLAALCGSAGTGWLALSARYDLDAADQPGRED
ncbi:hypothetical protein G6F31_021346 [Rhizopus arrhizus]|nr:hypothetical protein G6F31_021346 [Rhizopus arrhizus]